MSDKEPNSEDLKDLLEKNFERYAAKTGKKDESAASSSEKSTSTSGSSSQSASTDRTNTSSSSNSSKTTSSASKSSASSSNQDDEFDELGRTKQNRANKDNSSGKNPFGNFSFFNNKKTKVFGGNGGGNNSNPNLAKGIRRGILGVIAIFAIGSCLLDGFYTVNESERGVVTRFGKYVDTTLPGLNWKIPYIDSVQIVNVKQVNQFHIGGIVLTQDANLVNVSMNIQYQIEDPKAYLFNVDAPVQTLQKASEAALRQTIGHMSMDDVLTTGRGTVRQDTYKNLLSTIKPYDMGIDIVAVNFQYARPPEQVKAAFDDAIKAQEDEERFKREANAYMLAQLPIAHGEAQQITNQAQAYAKEVVFKAEGAQASFNRLLPVYKSNPQIFKQRYYYATMAQILGNVPKVIVEKGVNLNFLSLDNLFNKAAGVDKSNGKLLRKPVNAPAKGSVQSSSTGSDSSSSSSSTGSGYGYGYGSGSSTGYGSSSYGSGSSTGYGSSNSYGSSNGYGSNSYGSNSYGSSNSNNPNAPSTFNQDYSKGGN